MSVNKTTRRSDEEIQKQLKISQPALAKMMNREDVNFLIDFASNAGLDVEMAGYDETAPEIFRLVDKDVSYIDGVPYHATMTTGTIDILNAYILGWLNCLDKLDK